MGAIKREPTPPGPVTELFNRLHEVHLRAGQPSMREIVTKIGRGVISPSTVHNIFRGPRVPKWGFLELVIEELHGDNAEFLALWQAARRSEDAAADNQGTTSLRGYGPSAIVPSARRMPVIEPTLAALGEHTAPGSSQRIRSHEIPPRNCNFTGRVAELEALHANLIARRAVTAPGVQVISGMGGIGKTEIATEYIHRHIDKYEIIWWIRAEHHDRVREALVRLGQRLELREATPTADETRRSRPSWNSRIGSRPSWLLVYDNAAQPLDLQGTCQRARRAATSSLPHGLELARLHTRQIASTGALYRDDAISFLRRRVPSLASSDGSAQGGRRRGEARGRPGWRPHSVICPSPTEHAAAYLTETGQSVDDYLTRFAENAHSLSSGRPAISPPRS